jgi:hypothetical protein
VSPAFAVAVKLNSADVSGAAYLHDAHHVIGMLERLGVDLVVLCGGSYESSAMTGRPADARTTAREAYFLEPAIDRAEASPLPPMLTGGTPCQATLCTAVAVCQPATVRKSTGPDDPAHPGGRLQHGAAGALGRHPERRLRDSDGVAGRAGPARHRKRGGLAPVVKHETAGSGSRPGRDARGR